MTASVAAGQRTDFRIAGIGYAVTGQDTDLAERLIALFKDNPGDDAPPDWQIAIRRAPLPDPPAGHTPVWSGDLPEGTPATVWRLDAAQKGIVVPEGLDARADIAAARITITVAPERDRLVYSTAVIQAIDVALTQAKREMVHAACLALPDPLGGSAAGCVLLLGDSGAGKSTTTLALGHAGWPAGGDDATVLLRRSDGLVAYPYRRAFKVHRRSAALMPWLADAAGDFGEREEIGLAPGKLADRMALLDPDRDPLAIAGIVFLEPRNETGHRVEPLTPTQAAVRLYANNLHIPERRLDAVGQENIAIFAALAREARFRLSLSAAPALDTLGPTLAGAIKDAIALPESA